MKIDDTQGQLVDNQYRSIVVIFNTSSKAQTFSSDKLVTNNFQLHPIQQQGADLVTKQSSVQANGFTVPALTSAVFVAARD
jgi:hypothetical protein